MRPAPALKAIHVGGFSILRRGRFWRVSDPQGCLIVTAVYKKGALEVVRRLLPPDLRHLVDLDPVAADRPRPPALCRQAVRRYDPHAT